MAKQKIYGRCALCQTENVELMQSHIIPKAIYKRTKSFENSRFRSFYEPKEIFQDGEKKPMLCHDCEEFFSKYETKFTNLFLDKYLENPLGKLPTITEEINFYILTVAWRIIYDDLYELNSYPNDSERRFLEEYEHKLRKFLYERYLEENPGKCDMRQPTSIPDMDGKCFGEIIAEIENYEKRNSLEDMSEVKNYVYTLNELGFTDAVAKLFDSIIFGYSFYNTTRTTYYIISGYKDLIITTAYHRKRNILITDDLKLLKKSRSSKRVVKKELIEAINTLIGEMRSEYPIVQEKLNENGLREKIAKRFDGQKK